MHKSIMYSLAVLASGTAFVVASRSAVSAAGQGVAVVRLQTTTPGSAQVGHVSVAGTGVFDKVGVGDSTPGAPFTVGNGDKFQIFGDGSVRFNDNSAGITFPAVTGSPSGMIKMFSSGSANANRMVLSHSAAFPDWGLQYRDVGDEFHFLGSGTSFMAIDLGSKQVRVGDGTLTNVMKVDGPQGSVDFMNGNAMEISGTEGSVSFQQGENLWAVGGSRAIYATTSAWDPNSSEVAAIVARNTNASAGVGIIGHGKSVGLYGLTSEGYAVYGLSNFGRGMYGYTSSGFGVYGRADNVAGYAGYFQGALHVAGTLSKSGGAFKIDDPRDPENKYLTHSFVESPDMMNIYNGNAVTDGEGLAAIQLPSYFCVLNKDFRYQLTVMGGKGFAQAKIEEEVSNNMFVIRTSEPNVKVSWQVTGIRKDPWAEQNRIVPETDKPAKERGTYLNPEAYGQPDSKRFGYDGRTMPKTGNVDDPSLKN